LKELTEKQLIDILPTDSATVDEASKLYDLACIMFKIPSFLKHSIAEGWTTPSNVEVNGKLAYLICYHLSVDGGLFVDACVSLDKHTRFEMAFAAAEIIARTNKAKYIRFLTLRQGITISAQRQGFIPEAVCMVKHL